MWAVFGESTLARLDPSSSRVTGRGFAGGAPSGIVYAEHSVWVTNSGDANVERFDPTTFSSGPVGTPTSVGPEPSSIAYGNGALWVSNAGEHLRHPDRSSHGLGAADPVGARPTAVVVGGGAVWVANSGDGTVSRIDPDVQGDRDHSHGQCAHGLAVSEGLVWVVVQAA